MSPLAAMTRAHWEAGRQRGEPLWEDLADGERHDLLEQMRAALTALRDNGVTEGMLEAGGEAVQSQSYNNAALARLTFRAMLDAALDES